MISKRNISRISKEENEKIDTYFSNIIQRFQVFLFSCDFDNDKRLEEVDIFNLYNTAWKKYALDWNSKRGRVVFCDPQAFQNYAMCQSIKGDEKELVTRLNEIL
ncbi:MAG TPA: hypothetical protein VFG24_09410 [Nitrosopumilaceae archaeon]|nr:hypothetical protein [Nitrosopumilaceae archaeon]